MRIHIKKVNGKWEVNGKPYCQLEGKEKAFFNEFLIAMRLNYKIENQPTVVAENYVGEKL